jgi:hypothetical protein
MKDLSIYESGSGGELLMVNSDISLADSLLQIVYLCLFGGNVEAITLGNENQGEVRNDWWGNPLIFKEEKDKQFNSITEKTLKKTALSSAGRILILNAVNEDLKSLKVFADVKADVIIKDSSKVNINVKLSRLKNKQDVTLDFLWDNVQNSVIFYKMI